MLLPRALGHAAEKGLSGRQNEGCGPPSACIRARETARGWKGWKAMLREAVGRDALGYSKGRKGGGSDACRLVGSHNHQI